MPDAPVPLLARHDRQILGNIKLRLDKQRSMDSLDFIAWSIANWPQIMRDKFGWMKKSRAPAQPAIKFFAKDGCFRVFQDAYAEHKEREARARLKDRDEAAIREKMSQGLTREKAILELATAKVRGEHQEDLEKRRTHLKQTYAALQAEKAKLRSGPAWAPKTAPARVPLTPELLEGIEVQEATIQTDFGRWEDAPVEEAPKAKTFNPYDDPNFDYDAYMAEHAKADVPSIMGSASCNRLQLEPLPLSERSVSVGHFVGRELRVCDANWRSAV